MNTFKLLDRQNKFDTNWAFECISNFDPEIESGRIPKKTKMLLTGPMSGSDLDSCRMLAMPSS